MKLERRHGMLLLSLLGVVVLASFLTAGARAAAPRGSGTPMAARADWEGVPYPALDRLIRQRVLDARARERAAPGGATERP